MCSLSPKLSENQNALGTRLSGTTWQDFFKKKKIKKQKRRAKRKKTKTKQNGD